MAGNDDGTGSSLLALLDLIRALDALLRVGLPQLIGKIIITDASGVHNGLWREDVLTARGSGHDV